MSFLSISFIISFLACSSKDEDEAVICTCEYVTISVKLLDQNKEPVILDNSKVLLNNKDITSIIHPNGKDNPLWGQSGNYDLIDDSMQEQLEGKSATATFIGYLSGKEVFKKDIIVTADACHVYCGENLSFSINLPE